MNRLLVFAAIAEAATGLALLLLPSLVGQWLTLKSQLSNSGEDIGTQANPRLTREVCLHRRERRSLASLNPDAFRTHRALK